jgi:alkylation response protein AidB-like acyl-CoA dehydrogenase
MHVALSNDQEALRSTTARFLDERMPVHAVRALRDDPAGYSSEYWSQGAELGWTSLLVDEDHGGGTVSGNPVEDLALIAHEFGTHAAPGPLVPVNVVALAIATSDSTAHQDRLADLMAGSATAAWCFSEPAPDDGTDARALRIRLDGDNLVISGITRPAENAASADVLLVTGGSEGGLSQVLIPADTQGVSITPLRSADLTRRYATVTFDNARVDIGAAIGGLGQAGRAVKRQRQVAVATYNAETMGAMQRAFEMTRAWVADRFSFGRALESYQEIKHRFADMLTWLEGSHAINDHAIAALDAGSPDADELTSAAAAFVKKYGGEMLQDCVQLHGGIGVTYEHDLHLFLRRVTVNRACFGTPDEHLRRVGMIAANRKDEQ